MGNVETLETRRAAGSFIDIMYVHDDNIASENMAADFVITTKCPPPADINDYSSDE
jgi:hypothetical protein